MSTTNDVTGDTIQSRKSTTAYKDNWDSIFKKKEVRGEQEDSGELRVPIVRSEGEGPDGEPSDNLREGRWD